MIERDPGQEAQLMLLPSPAEASAETPSEPVIMEGSQVTMPIDVPGNYPSVRLSDYYKSLKQALGYFGSMNKGENFRKRFETSPVFIARYNRRHGAGAANKKYDESLEAEERLDDLAREEFAKAFGREVLIASGIKTERAVDISMAKYYQEFRAAYAGLGNKRARSRQISMVDRRAKRYKKAEQSA